MFPMNKPKILTSGATIGIVCPSFHSTAAERKENFLRMLSAHGLKYKLGETYYTTCGYLAGTDEVRARDLMRMFGDPEVDAIVCLLGGYGATRIVDKLDYDFISRHPKAFIGFSDITVLLNALYQKAGVPSIHGLVGTFLGHPEIDSFSEKCFFDGLFGDFCGKTLSNPGKPALTLRGGITEGIIVGGNLSLIEALMGTPYAIDFTDKIVLIEDVDEKPYRIDRMLSCLRLSGDLGKAKGFVLGKFTDCQGPENTQTCQSLIEEYFQPLDVPVMYEFQTGHELPFIGIPIGLDALLDAGNHTLTILEHFYADK
jgi:muramoyltetrapeptide carboxypeptidase